MKRFAHYIVLGTLSLCTFSCRPMGDELLSYGQNDNQSYALAGKSYAGEFKALWQAMNENYCIWDYEAEYGLDWDEVYATYLPQFEALDDTTQHKRVSDMEFQALYEQILNPLHDGHINLSIKNLQTGKYIKIAPNAARIRAERGSENQLDNNTPLSLDAYVAGKVAQYPVLAYDHTGSTDICFELIESTCARASLAAQAYMAHIDSLGGPDESNHAFYAAAHDLDSLARELCGSIASARSLSPSYRLTFKNRLGQAYNALCSTYALLGEQIGVPLLPIDRSLFDDLLGTIQFALFKGNIAYLRLGSCGLTPYLEPSKQTHDTTTQLYAYQQAVNRVWHHWFDTIQSLHSAGTLGGVILDMRCNNGGYVNDYKYLLGALLPSGGFESHTLRVKNGTGRLDFAPLIPFTCPTYEGEHAAIESEPIVVLCNSASISMAENTSWGVTRLPNGALIGTRTYGALSALNADPSDYSATYSGAFGEAGVTPVCGYVPKYVCLYPDENGNLRPLESIGITPTKEVPLDAALWETGNRDNQLEAALDYISQ